jgi:hypothetical protein
LLKPGVDHRGRNTCRAPEDIRSEESTPREMPERFYRGANRASRISEGGQVTALLTLELDGAGDTRTLFGNPPQNQD